MTVYDSRIRPRWFRPTLRLRLTILNGVLLIGAALVLVVLGWLVVGHAMSAARALPPGTRLVDATTGAEVDFGAWTGMSFEDLAADGTWNFWTMLRSVARPPEGETMREVQDRVLRYLARAHKNHPGERIVVVTHLEVIRAAVLACQGRSLDAYAEVSVAPAGVVEITLSDEGAQLVVEAAV